jgi:type II secretory pathway component PulF
VKDPAMRDTILGRALQAIRRAWRRAWATAATRVESAAVLRLVAASITAGVPVATMLDAWAEDGRGGQGTRLERAARLLRRGATVSEAVARVPGLVQEDHAVALAFGERIGLVGPVVRATLAGDELLDPTARRELRAVGGYLAVVVVSLSVVSGFLAVKILPQFLKIIDDMGTTRPRILVSWLSLMEVLGGWLWVPACLAAMVAVGACSTTGRSIVTRPFSRPRRVTAALDALAVAEAGGRPVDEAAVVLAECQSDPVLAAMLARVPGPEPRGGRLCAAGLVDARQGAALDAPAADASAVLHAAAAARRFQSNRRRLVLCRMLGPVMALAVGVFVLFQALAVFVPLVDIIHALS